MKVPWELSRFQHLSTLGQAYVLTGDRKYCAESAETGPWMGFEGEIQYAGIVHRRTISVDTGSGRWKIEDRVLCPKPLGGRVALHLSPAVAGRDGYIFEKNGKDAFACIEIESGRMDV